MAEATYRRHRFLASIIQHPGAEGGQTSRCGISSPPCTISVRCSKAAGSLRSNFTKRLVNHLLTSYRLPLMVII
jgi:hypothetical protein